MPRKRGRRPGDSRDRDRYLKLDAIARLVEVMAMMIKALLDR